MICIDTNVVIGILTGRRPEWMARIAEELRLGSPLLLPVGVLYELLYGAAKSAHPDRNRARIADFLTAEIAVAAFTPEDAGEAGGIRAYLESRGTPIGPIDILIAAQARRRGAVLVTDNRRDFERVPALIVTDWG